MPNPTYTENRTPEIIINTLDDKSKLSQITVGENEIVLVPDEIEEEIAKKQDKLVAGTNITLVDDPLTQTTLISSTAQESFFRGKWATWTSVPTDSTQYDPEPGTQDKTTPTTNDFMVIADASDYAGVEVDVFTNEGATILNEYWSVTDFLPVSPGTYAKVNYTRSYGQSARGQISLYTENKTLLYSRECQTTTGSGDYTDEFQLPNNCYYVKVQYMTNYDATEVLTLGGAGMFTGSWRFYYSGVWSVDGKSGWTPQYQIENTLPIASSTIQGIAKLYTITGQNTDGSITQKLFTDTTNNKLDKVTTASKLYGTDSNGNQTTYNAGDFENQVDDVKIYGTSKVDRPTKTANLKVVEQEDNLPTASIDYLGRIYQYTGATNLVTGLDHGFFYECIQVQTENISTDNVSVGLTITVDESVFITSGLTYGTHQFTFDGTDWNYSGSTVDLTDFGITVTGTPSENDSFEVIYDEPTISYEWAAIPVQPDAEPITSAQIQALWSE